MDVQVTERPEGRIRLAILALRISEGLYVLMGICLPILVTTIPEVQKENPLWAVICASFLSLGSAVFIEIVVRGLKHRKFWAWVAGLCISGFHIPSLFFPLGVMGLVGLLDSASRAAVGIGRLDQHTKPRE